MRILVAESLSEEGLALLRARHRVDVRPDLARPAFLAALPDYDALVVRNNVRVDAEAIAAGQHLVVIGRAGVGLDNVDVDAATRAGITVVNAPTGNTTAAAEHTLGLMLALARRIAEADASVRRGEWLRNRFTGVELRGRTLGIVGLGRIGTAVAARARALGMEVIAHDPFVSAEAAANHGVTLVRLDDVLARSDVVSLHVPETQLTRGMIGAAQLARMKPTALLVNLSRGAVVDEAALASALSAGRIAGAAVDVFASEPPTGSPLLLAPNTLLTPHLGASTAEAEVRVAVEVSEQVIDVLAGQPARFAVNVAWLPAETERALAPFLPLADVIGQFYAQFVRGPANDLTLEVAGELAAHDTGPLAAAVLSGVLRATTTERVNPVNAMALAQSRGLRLTLVTTPDAGTYASLITLRGSTNVSGTIANGERRLVRLGEYWIDLVPAAHMVVTCHRDLPSTMGRIGIIVGEAGVNISDGHLARRRAHEDALMVLAVDEPVPDRVVSTIRADSAVNDAWLIRLDLPA